MSLATTAAPADPRTLAHDDLIQARAEAVANFVSAKMGTSFRVTYAAADYVRLRREGKPSSYIAVTGSVWNGAVIVRSLLRVTGRQRCTWLTNGQASRGTQAVRFWGEGREARCLLRLWGGDLLQEHLAAEDERWSETSPHAPRAEWKVEEVWRPR